MEPYGSRDLGYYFDNFQTPDVGTYIDYSYQYPDEQNNDSQNQQTLQKNQQQQDSITVDTSREDKGDYILKQLQNIQSTLQNTQFLVEQSLRTAGLSQQKIEKIWDKKVHQQKQIISDKNQPQPKRKIKEKQLWPIEEHLKLLEHIKKFGINNIKEITKLMDGRTEPQVRSHLQKYKDKLNKASSEVRERLNIDKSINEFQQQFSQLPEDQKEKQFIYFLQQFKTKFFNRSPPITTNIIATAMNILRRQYPDQILFGNYLPQQPITEQAEIYCAIAGEYYQNNGKVNLFVYPEYNSLETKLNIKETITNFQVDKNSMSSIAEQQKKSANYSFNCNFVMKQCIQVLMDLLERQKFKEVVSVILLIEQQVIRVGDTFDYSIDLQCSQNGKNVDQIKLYMFCLRCATSL